MLCLLRNIKGKCSKDLFYDKHWIFKCQFKERLDKIEKRHYKKTSCIFISLIPFVSWNKDFINIIVSIFNQKISRVEI